MKKLLRLIIPVFVASILWAGCNPKANAQDADPITAPPISSSTLENFKPLLTASNWTAAPYLTYAPDAPDKVGGGLLCVYNLNNYVGGGVGLDWLGHFSLVSGNLTLKYPIDLNLFGKPLTVTPFGIGGIATPVGGAGKDNGAVSTIAGAGAVINNLFHVAGGNCGIGAAMVNWTSAGDYSGKHYQVFATWHKAF